MAFPQLGYPQYLSASQAVYAADRQGVLASSRGGAELGANPAAAVTSVLGMYANPYTAQNYSAFLPYTTDLTMFSQMVSASSLLQHFEPTILSETLKKIFEKKPCCSTRRNQIFVGGYSHICKKCA